MDIDVPKSPVARAILTLVAGIAFGVLFGSSLGDSRTKLLDAILAALAAGTVTGWVAGRAAALRLVRQLQQQGQSVVVADAVPLMALAWLLVGMGIGGVGSQVARDRHLIGVTPPAIFDRTYPPRSVAEPSRPGGIGAPTDPSTGAGTTASR